MDDHPFNREIQRIWEEHRSRNILTRALGPDPVSFAWDVIRAWQDRNTPDFDDWDDGQ